MNVYAINIEQSSKIAKNIGVFANEKLAKQAAKKYVEEEELDVKKKRSKKDDIRKVLYLENVKETPFAITLVVVPIDLDTIMEKQAKIMQEIECESVEIKKSKGKKDPNAPKKPPSAYMIFVKENRQSYDGTYKEITETLKNEWKEMDESYKETYKVKSKEYKQKYDEDIAEYKQKCEEQEIEMIN